MRAVIEVAGWLAPAATMGAAIMTALNLGARVTGIGFIVFTVGSISWCFIAMASGQHNLLWTNGFLTLVNGVGIWRWLGRQARYEDGGKAAASASALSSDPTLCKMGALAGAELLGPGGDVIATVVDGMLNCHNSALAYLVVTDGGLAGFGERLFMLTPDEVRLTEAGVICAIAPDTLFARAPIEAAAWPASAGDGSDTTPERKDG